MFATRWLRRSALLAPLALVLVIPANASADVRGSALGGCSTFSFSGADASWCLGAASGRGQGDDPYSFRFVTGTGMGYTQSDDGPPCATSSRGADPTLTYFAVRPDHSASATVHFKGTWFTGPSFYDPDTGQCGEPRTTSDSRPWDMNVTWTPIPESEFVTVCFSPPWDCSPGGYFPPDVIVRKREVRRWWG